MDILVGILVGAAAILVVLFVLGRKALRPGVDPTQLTFDPAVMAEVRSLALGGDKIGAIKLLRDQNPGLGLASAKQLVDRMVLSAQRPTATGAGPGADGRPVAGDAARQDKPVPDQDKPVADTGRPDRPVPVQPRSDSPVAFDTTPSSSTVPLDVELDARNLKALGRTAAAVALIAEQTGCTPDEAAAYVDEL